MIVYVLFDSCVCVSSVPDSELDSLPELDPVQACFSTQRSSCQPLNMQLAAPEQCPSS